MHVGSRRWLAACLTLVLLILLLLSQWDNQRLFNTLHTTLAEQNIQFDAQEMTLSWMYFGSIRLDHVHAQNSDFAIDAQRMFIDLDLAALLIGKAKPKALYMQRADIRVYNTPDTNLLSWSATKQFGLQRIDISRSSLSLTQDDIQLKQMNLDIRDLGINKNPRMELRAHIGSGRIDAHGYLQLKHGEVMRGFGRLRLYDIPLQTLVEQTTLQTLNGSLTAHLNMDQTWQTFGHLALQKNQTSEVEFRGKLTGDAEHFFHIDNAILDIKNAGSIQFFGGCEMQDKCEVQTTIKRFDIAPVLALLKQQRAASSLVKSVLTDINLTTKQQGDALSTSGSWAWPALALNWKNAYNNKNHAINLPEGRVDFSGLTLNFERDWTLEHASVSGSNHSIAFSLDHAIAHNNTSVLPVRFYDTNLWLPLAHFISFLQSDSPELSGNGTIYGEAKLTLHNQHIQAIQADLTATQAKLQWRSSIKPMDIVMQIRGQASWPKLEPEQIPDAMPTQASFFVAVDKAQASFDYNQQKNISIEQLSVDFNQLKERGIKLPLGTADWHGYAKGKASFNAQDFSPREVDLDVINFGVGSHRLSGKISKDNQRWRTDHLFWEFEKNKTFVTSQANGAVNIDADTLTGEGLVYIQQLPFPLHGKLFSKSMILPFGTLKDVSTQYESKPQHTSFKNFKSTFYEGSLRAKNLELTQQANSINLQGAMQVGGIRLNNWTWLHKQFQTHLEGSVYATLNLNTNYDALTQLTGWRGDGDVMIYNGKWLLNGINAQADKVSISLRKRNRFTSTFRIKHGQKKGSGHLVVDAQQNASGDFAWLGETYTISKTWPLIHYTINPKTTP